MKRFLTMLLLAMMSFGTISQTFATPFQQPTKKDGTPDKRFKANKAAKGPLKKDGTPDMRHKVNKTGAGKQKAIKN